MGSKGWGKEHIPATWPRLSAPHPCLLTGGKQNSSGAQAAGRVVARDPAIKTGMQGAHPHPGSLPSRGTGAAQQAGEGVGEDSPRSLQRCRERCRHVVTGTPRCPNAQ